MPPTPPPAAGARAPVPAWLWAVLVAPLLLVGEAVFGPKVLSQADALLLFAPWSAHAPEDFQAGNPLLLDQSLGMRPWLDFAAERLRDGELPLWNPYNFLGQPLHAAQSGAFLWPGNWLFLARPDWGTYAWMAWLHLALAGLGMFGLLRRFGLTSAGAATGGVAFALAGFQVAWMGHPHVHAALLLPWLVWAVEGALEPRSAGGRRRALAGAALCVGLLGVGGHVQTALHVGLFAGAWALLRVFWVRRGDGPVEAPGRLSGLAGLGGAALLGLALGAPQLLPFAEYLGDSRAANLATHPEAVGEFSPRDGFLGLVAPERLGNPTRGPYLGPEGPHVNYSELIAPFVGRVALLLALAGLILGRRRREVWMLAGLGGAAALAAWGVFPFLEAAKLVPGLRETKLLRLGLLTAFALAALAAFGLDGLCRALTRPAARTLVGALALLAVAVELGQHGRGYNPIVERDLLLPPTATGAFLAEQEADGRVLGLDGTYLIPGANLFLRVPLLTGYDAIERAAVSDLIALLSSDPQGAWFAKEIRWFDRQLPLGALLGVNWVLSGEPLPEPFRLAHEGELRTYEAPLRLPPAFLARGVVVLADPRERLEYLASPELDPRLVPVERLPEGREAFADPPGAEPRGDVRWIENRSLTRRLEVSLAEPALLVLSSAHDPGWRASADGRELPIERVAHALQGLWLDAGEHEITLRYQPRSFALGALLAGLALPILLFLALPGGPRRGSLAVVAAPAAEKTK